jgi:hypothetical protein
MNKMQEATLVSKVLKILRYYLMLRNSEFDCFANCRFDACGN